MLDNFFEFIFDWMVSMQFFQVLSWSHSLLLPDDFLLSSYYLLFSSLIFLFTFGKTATLKWFTFTKLFEIPFLRNLINLSWQRKFRFETSFLGAEMDVALCRLTLQLVHKVQTKNKSFSLNRYKNFQFFNSENSKWWICFLPWSLENKSYFCLSEMFFILNKLEKTFIYLVGIKRSIVWDL